MNSKNCFCQFCHLRQNKTNLVIYQDQDVFAFHDINKASAVQHILVCPIQHIQTVDDVVNPQLITKMKDVGVKILQGFNKGDQFRFGFHRNNQISIYHLHLHCFIEPITAFTQDKVQYGHMLHRVDKIIAQLEQRAKL